MRFLIVLCLIVAGAKFSHGDKKLAQQMLKQYYNAHQEIKKQCLAEVTGIESLESTYENTGEIVKDEHLGCFIKCVFIKDNIITENGDVVLETMKKNLKSYNYSESFYDDLYKTCYENMDKTDLCQTALELGICFFKFADNYQKQ